MVETSLTGDLYYMGLGSDPEVGPRAFEFETGEE